MKAPMLKLLAYGLLAALFFSVTFVLNRAMSLEGGHWAWTAALRYGYTLLILALGLAVAGRWRLLGDVLRTYARHWLFWTVAGGIGFGVFYTGVTFASVHAPGWVVATTWQLTILATPLVLALFGRRVPVRGLLFSVLIFLGIVLVNAESATQIPWPQSLLGALPVLVSAFAYPFGLQLVWEARQGGRGWAPAIATPAMENPFGRVLLLVLGSIPWWIGLLLVVQPPSPTPGQWINTAVVALSAGVVATALFLHARHLARSPYELAAADSTQSAEVIFALAGEVILLGGALPGLLGWAGIALTVAGLILYLLAQGRRRAQPPQPKTEPALP